MEALLSETPERGGVLGAKPGQPISKFYYDESGISTPDSYTPDYQTINSVLDNWEQEEISMVGMVHSHAGADAMPSCGDLYYCEKILLSNSALGDFYLPIVSVETKNIHPYRCHLTNGHIVVVKDEWMIND